MPYFNRLSQWMLKIEKQLLRSIQNGIIFKIMHQVFARYLEVVLRRSAMGSIVWSDHLQAMIACEPNHFSPEQYTDPHGLLLC